MNSCYWGLRLQSFYNHLIDLTILWLFFLNFHENTLKTFLHMFIHICFWTELVVSIPYHLLNLSRKLKATSFSKVAASELPYLLCWPNQHSRWTWTMEILSVTKKFVILIATSGQFIWFNKVITTWHHSKTVHTGGGIEFPPNIHISVNSAQYIFKLPELFAMLPLFLNRNHKLFIAMLILMKYLFTDNIYFP